MEIKRVSFAACEQAFRAVDLMQRGEISAAEVPQAFERMGMHISPSECSHIIDVAGRSGRSLRVTDFYHLIYIFTNLGDSGDVKRILFLAADTDCQRSINASKLDDLLRKLGMQLTAQHIKDIMEGLADQKDKTMSYQMFCAFVEAAMTQ